MSLIQQIVSHNAMQCGQEDIRVLIRMKPLTQRSIRALDILLGSGLIQSQCLVVIFGAENQRDEEEEDAEE